VPFAKRLINGYNPDGRTDKTNLLAESRASLVSFVSLWEILEHPGIWSFIQNVKNAVLAPVEVELPIGVDPRDCIIAEYWAGRLTRAVFYRERAMERVLKKVMGLDIISDQEPETP
jgi:hypothetical protein